MSEELEKVAPKRVRKSRAKKKKPEMMVKGDTLVKGNKKNTIDTLVNKEGFYSDSFGNTIYQTESKENKARLKKLGLK